MSVKTPTVRVVACTTFEILLSVCLPVRPSVRLSGWLRVGVSLGMPIYLYITCVHVSAFVCVWMRCVCVFFCRDLNGTECISEARGCADNGPVVPGTCPPGQQCCQQVTSLFISRKSDEGEQFSGKEQASSVLSLLPSHFYFS